MKLTPPTYRPVACGTYSGYTSHYQRGETPCAACKAARLDYDRRRRATKRTAALIEDGVTVPSIMLAELYLAAPISLQDRLDQHLGTDLVDALIKAHDDYVDMCQKGNAA